MKKTKQYIDHVDIVTSHICNNHCEHCIDKFVHTSNEFISLKTVKKFLRVIRKHTDRDLEVLLLGGEPTCMPFDSLVKMSKLVHKMGFRIIMSTNGKLQKKIESLIPYFDSIQVTIHSDEEIDHWRQWPDKINIKIAGDADLTMEKLQHFIDYTKGFDRRSVSMYFTPDGTELCTDERIWDLLNTLEWKRNGSYEYAFYEGVRFKKGIPGETNIIDEPTVPKVYPNGNYNKTWNDEKLDDYLYGKWAKEKRTFKDMWSDMIGFLLWSFVHLSFFLIMLLSLPVAIPCLIIERCKEKRKRKQST